MGIIFTTCTNWKEFRTTPTRPAQASTKEVQAVVQSIQPQANTAAVPAVTPAAVPAGESNAQPSVAPGEASAVTAQPGAVQDDQDGNEASENKLEEFSLSL